MRVKTLAIAAAIALLGGSISAQAAPGDLSRVSMQARTGIDTKVYFSGDPIVMEVSLHFHPPGTQAGYTITASTTVPSGSKTRREMAEDMGDAIVAELADQGVPDPAALVDVRGATVYCKGTPPGEGPNTGTVEDPVISPQPTNKSKPHSSTFTDSQ